ncbi:AAA family ATPase [Halalkalibacter oceani]|uniref:AAA family ATPase n=1 Tax=Halalkalibacter oceani TaxID=1653776 RepID=UPI00339780A5
MDGQLFPIELTKKSAYERINYFKNLTIAHPKLMNAFKEFKDIISVADKNEILLIFGPSGVGKSTLFKKIIDHYNETHMEDMFNDKGFIPIVGDEAIAPDDGRFDWKDFYIRALSLLNEPLIDYKINIDVKTKEIIPSRNSKNAYRRAMENALIYRKPRAFLIDEAQHIARVARGRSLRNQMDTLKSLSSVSKVPFVLFGTYEILKFRNLSGQLIRRGIDVHLPRYKMEIKDDRAAFQNVLWTFQKHLPFYEEPQLVDHWEYFYMHSVGCVGNLKIWLNRTVEYNLTNDQHKKTLALNDFKRFEISIDKIEKMADETIEMEKQMESNDNKKKERVSTKLGLMTNQYEVNDLASKSKKPKVGERKPTRDQIGIEEFKNEKLNS